MDQKEIEQFSEQVKALQEALAGLTGATEKADASISGELGKKFPNAAKPAMAALSGLGNAVTDVTAALYRGERGMKVMANGIDTMVDGLQSAAAIFTMFTPWGKALSVGSKLLINGVAMAAKGVSSLNKLNAEQSDRLYKVYQDLSNVGAAGAGGLEKLFDTMQQAGFTAAELDQFSAAIKRNAQDLAVFGASTAQGAENLAKMSGGLIKGDLGMALMNLGYNAESLANSTATYLVLQNRLGNVQTKTATQLQKEAGAYAVELDKLTRLTGLSREEQEKRQRSLMSDERYASFMATTARTEGYDIQKLDSFFSGIDNETTRKGLQHIFAGRGSATSPEAIQVMQSDPMAFQRMMRVARGGSPIEEIEGFYGAAHRYMTGVGGQTGQFTGAGPGISVSQNLEYAEKVKQMGAAAAQTGKNLEESLKTEQAKAMADDKELKRQNELRLQQLGVAQTLDSTVKKFTLLNSTTDALNSGLSKLATTLGVAPAGGTPAGGKGAGASSVSGAQGLAGLREMIASKESGGNYNVMVGGQNADLTNMTIAQVMELQKNRIAAGQGSAAGKYQIINKTLQGLITEGGIDTGAKFDQGMQDRLADMLIQRRGYGSYQAGKISKEQFARNLSQEWAALPAGPSNQSYYQGVGNNKAGYSWDQVMQTMGPGPSGAFGFNGTLSGPMSGYRPNILMHGTEELSIRPMGGSSDGYSSGSGSGMDDLISEMSELVSISRRQLYTAEKILKYQQ